MESMRQSVKKEFDTQMNRVHHATYFTYSLIIDQDVPCCYVSVNVFLEGKIH